MGLVCTKLQRKWSDMLPSFLSHTSPRFPSYPTKQHKNHHFQKPLISNPKTPYFSLLHTCPEPICCHGSSLEGLQLSCGFKKIILFLRGYNVTEAQVRRMIGSKRASELQVMGAVSEQLKSAGFAREGSLWVKESAHPSAMAVQLSKRYPFTKLGKVLGIEITRFLALCGDHLFYFDEPQAGRILGYCSLEETYIQWLPLRDGRFLLLLSNGTETSEFYFSTPHFWQQQRVELARTAVLLGFSQDFETLEELGQGSFAKVFRVRECASGAQFAAKRVGKDECSPSLLRMMMEERKVLAGLKGSSHVYQFRGFYETNEEYVMLTEYLPGVDLMSFLRMRLSLPIEDLKKLLTGLLKGIKECHDRRVIHRDIKPQNVMVNLHTLKPTLIDFGLSLRPTARRCNERRCGTVGYMAPEVYKCSAYSQKCDVFSFGVVAHLLLLGSNPLKGKNYEETCRNSHTGKIELDEAVILQAYGSSGLAFLRKTLATSPQERCSISQALLSPFLQPLSSQSD